MKWYRNWLREWKSRAASGVSYYGYTRRSAALRTFCKKCASPGKQLPSCGSRNSPAGELFRPPLNLDPAMISTKSTEGENIERIICLTQRVSHTIHERHERTRKERVLKTVRFTYKVSRCSGESIWLPCLSVDLHSRF